MRIDAVEVHDVRFPTSRTLAGSDAMNPDPDYSAAYVVLRTDDGPDGHGLAFTIGRGNEVCVAAVKALEPLVVGSSVKAVLGDLGGFWRTLTGDSQLRWIGPEKGAIHLATAAVVNAAWDLAAKTAGKPLWRYLADLSTDEILDVIPFAYLEDALTPDEARELLERAAPGREDRERQLLAEGYPAYTSSAGWLGYSDAQVQQLAVEALDEGFDHLKLKVGRDLEDDLRRGRVLRELLGPDRILSVDANQRWGVPEAIRWMEDLRSLDPYWIEEPTSPDDVLGHAAIARAVAPIRVATGEHVHNRVMFKQLLASGAIDVCQIDACRLGGVNEVLAVLLLAAKAGVPVCPHAGGVGLCEMVQHLSMFDFLRVSGSTDGRWIEYVDHLHQHFVDPVMVRDGRYQAPSRPGYSTELYPTSVAQHRFPDGSAWREAVAQ